MNSPGMEKFEEGLVIKFNYRNSHDLRRCSAGQNNRQPNGPTESPNELQISSVPSLEIIYRQDTQISIAEIPEFGLQCDADSTVVNNVPNEGD